MTREQIEALAERLHIRSLVLPQEIAERENQADAVCGSYGTATAKDFQDDPDVLLLREAAAALRAIAHTKGTDHAE